MSENGENRTDKNRIGGHGTGNIIRRTLTAFFGLVVCGIGISFFLYADLGVDPASVLELGIANVARISYGTAAALLNVVILAVVLLIDRTYINISSVLAIFCIGYTADFMKGILQMILPEHLNLIWKLALLLAGLLIMATGIAAYIGANLGVGAIDLVSEIISNKLRISYRLVRVAGDIGFVAAGFFLGGTLGVGTVVAAFMTGPAVQFVRPAVHRAVDRIVKQEGEKLDGTGNTGY